MKNIYWSVCAFDINENKRSTFSPQFNSEKDAKLWKMKYIIEHPDDYIMFDLMKDDGRPYSNDIGCVISEVWAGHEHKAA